MSVCYAEISRLCTKCYIRFLPKSWNTERNLEGTAWGNSRGAYVLCEVSLWSQRPVLRMYAGKAPEKLRDQLWIISRQPPFQNTQNRKANKYMSFYSVKNTETNLKDIVLGDEDQAAKKVWDWVKSQLNEDHFKKSVEIVARHLEQL